MTAPLNYLDAEDITLQWLLDSPIADLVSDKIFLGMPDGSPTPSIILSRVGGAPVGRGDLTEDQARISFSVWGKNRRQCKDIAKALVAELESIGYEGGFESVDGYLQSAEVLNWLWLPDAKTARYTVDALIVTTTKPTM